MGTYSPRQTELAVCENCGAEFGRKSTLAKICPKCREEKRLADYREYYRRHRSPDAKARTPDAQPRPETVTCQRWRPGCATYKKYRCRWQSAAAGQSPINIVKFSISHKKEKVKGVK